jgi:hypothetical protein
VDLNVEIASLPVLEAPPTPMPTPTLDSSVAEEEYKSDFRDWCCGIGGYTEDFGELYDSINELNNDPDRQFDAAWGSHVLFQLNLIRGISRDIADYTNVPPRLKGVHDDMKVVAQKLSGAADLFQLGIDNQSSALIKQANGEASDGFTIMVDASKRLDELVP